VSWFPTNLDARIPHCLNISKFHKHRNRFKINTLSTQINDRSLSWLGTGTSIKSGGVKAVL